MLRISETGKRVGLVLVPLVLIVVAAAGYEYFPSASNQGYSPEQPIPFSHKIHAGDNKIPCLYCHTHAERSRHATIPAMNVCMNCHSVVKTDSPYIQKLTAAYHEGKPIEWIRVHELPDFVYFPHKRHVQKGIACETCHGNVKEMARIEQKAALTMGWCMQCHRGETTPKNILAQAYPGYPQTKDRPEQVAPTQCSTCHR